MNVTLLFFARAREVAGRSEARLELSAGATIDDALAAATDAWPALGEVLPSCRTALDEEFARGDAALTDGSVVAVLPPVSGG